MKSIIIQAIVAIGVGVLSGACGTAISQGGVGQAEVVVEPAPKRFVHPILPAGLTSSRERADFVATRYWDGYDFTDTTLLSNPELCEQVFVDYLPVLFNASPERAEQGIQGMLERAIASDSLVFQHFFDLCERYLYHPNSPMRNEDMYIPVLRWAVASDKLDQWEKIRPQHQLTMALKNRPGEIATDFVYTLASGVKRRMSSIRADFTILFINNPDCEECRRTKEYMAASPVIGGRINPGSGWGEVAILAVYPDEDLSLWKNATYPDVIINSYDAGQLINNKQLYDLRAIPTLYLLDKNKRVLLKDVQIEAVEAWLIEHIKKTNDE